MRYKCSDLCLRYSDLCPEIKITKRLKHTETNKQTKILGRRWSKKVSLQNFEIILMLNIIIISDQNSTG